MIKISKFILLLSILCTLLTAAYTTVASESPTAISCDRQAKANLPCAFELPAETIAKLKIEAGFGWGIFSGSIYNGNSEYTVTQLEVSMEPIHDHHTMGMTHAEHAMSHEPKIKQINMNLLPLTKSAISMALDDDVVHVHDFKWKVLKAYGHKTQ